MTSLNPVTDRAKIMAFALQNDPMRMGEGAFIGLCTQNNVRVVRGGTGFAVKALTCNGIVLGFLNKMSNYDLNSSNDAQLCQLFDAFASNEVARHQREDIVLYLPDALAAHFSMGANKSVGLGGAEHELGHILCDKANKMTPLNWFKHFIKELRTLASKLEPTEELRYFTQTLGKFANLFADIRLENMMPVMYPPTKQRFVDTQKCIFTLEDQGLDQADSLSILLVMMRDLGKNHTSQELTDRLEFYKNNFPKEWNLVNQKFMDMIKQNQCQTDDIDGTLHFPMLSAIQFLIEVKDLIKNPPPEEGGDKDDEDEDEDDKDNPTKQPKDKKDKKDNKGNPKGKDKNGTPPDEDGGDKGKGTSKTDSKTESDSKSDSESESESESDSESKSETDKNEDKKPKESKKPSQSKSNKDLIEQIQRKLESGDYNTDTLDVLQEKAEKEIRKLDIASGSKTYIPNGNKVVYVDRKQADRNYPVQG